MAGDESFHQRNGFIETPLLEQTDGDADVQVLVVGIKLCGLLEIGERRRRVALMLID